MLELKDVRGAYVRMGNEGRTFLSREDEATRRILDMIEEQTRTVGEALHELYAGLAEYERSQGQIMERMERIRSLRDEVLKLKRDLYNYIARTTPGLEIREDWIRLTGKIVQVADYLEGIAYRVERLEEKGWGIPRNLISPLKGLVGNVVEAYEAFRKAIFALRYNLNQVLMLCREVSDAEKKADLAYRETDLLTLEELNKPQVHMIRVVIEFLEDIADAFEDASDDVMMIALHKFT
mgnify:CR=1 FL=1